MVGLSKWPAL